MAGDVSKTLAGLDVMVVEDSWNVANTIKSILEAAGANILGPYPTVAESLAKAEFAPMNIALVDLNLRDDFADALVERLADKGIPYVIVTAYEALPTSAYYRAAAVLQKPVDAGEIVSAVERFAKR